MIRSRSSASISAEERYGREGSTRTREGACAAALRLLDAHTDRQTRRRRSVGAGSLKSSSLTHAAQETRRPVEPLRQKAAQPRPQAKFLRNSLGFCPVILRKATVNELV